MFAEISVAPRVRSPWSWLVFATLFLLTALPASAQASRTWVSGVGDDVNPCSRTAPCKTFAGAISKTAAGGEINVLDPGAFGAVTITKSITISSESQQAGVLATLGSNGIVINAPATAVVVLRGLDIEGLGSGANGIRFLAGGGLHVEKCTINNFTQKGIEFVPSGTSELFVSDTVIRNTQVSSPTSGGLLVKPGPGGSATVSLDDVRLHNNNFGMRIEGGTEATVSRSISSGNITNGFIAFGSAVGPAVLNLESSVSSDNGANGVRSDQAGATIRISNVTITDNAQNGLMVNGGGAIVSFGNNSVAGNAIDGSPTSTVPRI